MNQHEISNRIEQFRADGMPENQIAERLGNDLLKESTGVSATEMREAITEAEETYSAHVFVQRHPEWQQYVSDENIELLQQAAREISNPFDLYALEAAFYDLVDTGELQPVRKSAPATAPALEPAPPFKKSGHGGTLTVDPATRGELSRLPLQELRKRANADRWNNLGPDRARRLKAGFTAI
jgi:hypothetical protein